LRGLRFAPGEVLGLAIEIQGRPDNAAAAIAGGLTLAFGDGVVRLDPHPDLRPVALVPEGVRLPTAEARAALSETVPRADAVYNAAHAAAAVVAFTARPEMLTQALGDRLHQDARLALVPAVREVFDGLRRAGVPVCVSGAGPSLLAFDLPGREVPDPGEGWGVLRPGVRSGGAEIVGE
ncbi:MAG: homoserine kinase, partial [Actinobacteria bacterium]|nr:homoserine kinase [Actinomycetota bacterium]